MTTFIWGSATDVGEVRDKNQDSVLAQPPLFVVADGMGGHLGGEVASQTALSILGKTASKITNPQQLGEAIKSANSIIWQKAQVDESLRGMGTTITGLLEYKDETDETKFAIANVGDSRSYLFRDDKLIQLSRDHSFVEEMVEAGELTRDEAEQHPRRNVLTRALGVEPDIEVDITEIQPVTQDRFLICSDGLTHELNDERIETVLRRFRDPDEACKELIRRAKSAGGHDNISVIVVDMISGDPNKQRQYRAPLEVTSNRFSITSINFRILGFVAAALSVLVIGFGSVIWYARSSYFASFEGEFVVIYRGRPEPVLWFKPTITERLQVSKSDIPPYAISELEKGKPFSSIEDTHRYIDQLVEAEKETLETTTTTSTIPIETIPSTAPQLTQ